MIQNLLIAALLWTACIAELGWTAWTDLKIGPDFLDLVVVFAGLVVKPRWIVFWGGLAGLCASVIHNAPVHLCLPLYGTVSLLVAWSKPTEMKRPTLTATTVRSLVVLLVLSIGKTGLESFPVIDYPTLLTLEHVAQVAFTFLISLMFCLLILFFQRRSAWD